MSLAEPCCPAGSFGAIGPNKAASLIRGKMTMLKSAVPSRRRPRAEMPCYQVGPSSPKYLAIVFSDVHGIDSGNHKPFCDSLQEKMGDEAAVWMPDLFRGHPMAPDVSNRNFKSYWVDLMCRLSIIFAEKTRITLPAVRADLEDVIQPSIPETVVKSGMVGFCFGAWVIGRSFGWSNNEKEFLPNLNAGVLIHPSWRPEGVVNGGGQSTEEMAEATQTTPMLILPGRNDGDFLASAPIPQQLARQRKLPIEKLVFEFDMDHGWVSRADSSNDDAMKEAQEQATQMTADFFKQYLK